MNSQKYGYSAIQIRSTMHYEIGKANLNIRHVQLQRLDLYWTLSIESGNLICILLSNFSFLDDMRFELDFKALHIYFVQKGISYLKKYIPGSQTTLVSCKNTV